MPDKIARFTRHKLWLAPLAGFTDNAFRTICKECGADVVVSEMISADGLIFNREKSLAYAQFDEIQRPFAIQLFGAEAEIMQKGAEIALQENPDILDINMGCPMKKVIKKGAGSALMQNPEEAEKIVQAVKRVIEKADIPLSVKIRAGWNKFSINAVDFGKRMEQAGADMICLHPRTRSQMFAGQSDWQLITELKKSVKIPVIGNGDIKDIDSAKQMFEQTGCDSIMIGRGILGNPWLFRTIKTYLETGELTDVDPEEKTRLIRKHIDLTWQEKGAERAIIELRSHFANYTKGFRGGAKVRNYINHCFDPDDIFELIKNLYLGQMKNG
ncbi:MAG: tRNA dihydrouridine synthase DusB [Candidatus Cloacimonadales bacterium]|nr:tRNA dihydrouridine synthase DusB [Candidatus Cloacimonadales bacterium]